MHLYKSHHHDINNLTRFSRQANRGLIRCCFPELIESFYSTLFLPWESVKTDDLQTCVQRCPAAPVMV